MLTIGHKFPHFTVKSVVSSDMTTAFGITSHETIQGQWSVFVFYPKDFTFVCPTELRGFHDLLPDFESRGAKVFGVSTDSEFVHLAWRKESPDLKDLGYPLLSDIKRELSLALGVLDAREGVCLRATFIVDPQLTIRHVSVNDLSVGRSPHEILRTLDALQNGGLTPCNWRRGEPVIKVA